MTEIDLILVLALSTFGLVSVWAYQTKIEAEKGLKVKQKADHRPSSRSR